MVVQYRKTETATHLCGYHIIWTTKYRRNVLDLENGEVSNRLTELIRTKATELGCEIEALETMPDHVHIFVYAPPKLSPAFIAGQFKGYTSNILRKEFKIIKSRLPSLWTRSYFVATVGDITAAKIKHYVESQRDKP